MESNHIIVIIAILNNNGTNKLYPIVKTKITSK